jgi:hypothetical protein
MFRKGGPVSGFTAGGFGPLWASHTKVVDARFDVIFLDILLYYKINEQEGDTEKWFNGKPTPMSARIISRIIYINEKISGNGSGSRDHDVRSMEVKQCLDRR